MKIFQAFKSAFYILLLIAITTSCYKTEKADLVVHNAVIYSVDENFTTYQAMAIADGKIIELGEEREIMNPYKADTVIYARPMPIFIGFYDPHSHFLRTATYKDELNILGVKSATTLFQKFISFAKINDS